MQKRLVVAGLKLLGTDEKPVGIAPGKLYHNLEIRGRKEIVLHDLNAEAGYYFAVDAFNDSGRTLGSPAVAR